MSVAWSGTTLKPLSQLDLSLGDQSPLFRHPEPEPEPEQMPLEREPARGYEMALICPEGVGPGEAVIVETQSPRAREVQAVVPDGVQPGDEFSIFVEEPLGIGSRLKGEGSRLKAGEHDLADGDEYGSDDDDEEESESSDAGDALDLDGLLGDGAAAMLLGAMAAPAAADEPSAAVEAAAAAAARAEPAAALAEKCLGEMPAPEAEDAPPPGLVPSAVDTALPQQSAPPAAVAAPLDFESVDADLIEAFMDSPTVRAVGSAHQEQGNGRRKHVGDRWEVVGTEVNDLSPWPEADGAAAAAVYEERVSPAAVELDTRNSRRNPELGSSAAAAADAPAPAAAAAAPPAPATRRGAPRVRIVAKRPAREVREPDLDYMGRTPMMMVQQRAQRAEEECDDLREQLTFVERNQVATATEAKVARAAAAASSERGSNLRKMSQIARDAEAERDALAKRLTKTQKQLTAAQQTMRLDQESYSSVLTVQIAELAGVTQELEEVRELCARQQLVLQRSEKRGAKLARELDSARQQLIRATAPSAEEHSDSDDGPDPVDFLRARLNRPAAGGSTGGSTPVEQQTDDDDESASSSMFEEGEPPSPKPQPKKKKPTKKKKKKKKKKKASKGTGSTPRALIGGSTGAITSATVAAVSVARKAEVAKKGVAQEQQAKQLGQQQLLHSQVVATAHRNLAEAHRGLGAAKQALSKQRVEVMRQGAWLGRTFWAWLDVSKGRATRMGEDLSEAARNAEQVRADGLAEAQEVRAELLRISARLTASSTPSPRVAPVDSGFSGADLAYQMSGGGFDMFGDGGARGASGGLASVL